MFIGFFENLSRGAFLGVDISGGVSDTCANDETGHRQTPPRQPRRQPADRAILARGNPAHPVRFAQAARFSQRHRAADHSALLRTKNKESKMLGVTIGIVGICLFAMMAFCNSGLK
jgi:hypothetical protein